MAEFWEACNWWAGRHYHQVSRPLWLVMLSHSCQTLQPHRQKRVLVCQACVAVQAWREVSHSGWGFGLVQQWVQALSEHVLLLLVCMSSLVMLACICTWHPNAISDCTTCCSGIHHCQDLSKSWDHSQYHTVQVPHCIVILNNKHLHSAIYECEIVSA